MPVSAELAAAATSVSSAMAAWRAHQCKEQKGWREQGLAIVSVQSPVEIWRAPVHCTGLALVVRVRLRAGTLSSGGKGLFKPVCHKMLRKQNINIISEQEQSQSTFVCCCLTPRRRCPPPLPTLRAPRQRRYEERGRIVTPSVPSKRCRQS